MLRGRSENVPTPTSAGRLFCVDSLITEEDLLIAHISQVWNLLETTITQPWWRKIRNLLKLARSVGKRPSIVVCFVDVNGHKSAYIL